MSRPVLHSSLRFTAILWVGLCAACGGGSSNSAPPSSAPVVPPPVALPTPSTESLPVEILLARGDVVADDLRVVTIEDGALGNARRWAAIVSSDGEARSIVGAASDGRIREFASPADLSAAGANPATITRLRMAPDGEIAFLSETPAGGTALHRIRAEGDIETLPSSESASPPIERIGEFRIGPGGRLAFVGGEACAPEELDPGDAGPARIECDLSLWIVESTARRIVAEDQTRIHRAPSAIRVEMDAQGTAFFSLPARRHEPALVRVGTDGSTEVLWHADRTDPSLGLVIAPEAIDMLVAGPVLVSGGLPDPEAQVGPTPILGLLDPDTRLLTEIVRQGDTVAGCASARLRGLALATDGSTLAEIRRDCDDDGTLEACLVRFDPAHTATPLVCEATELTGSNVTVLSLETVRVNASGKALAVVGLGRRTATTTYLDEIRAIELAPGGSPRTLVSSRDSSKLGTLSRLQIADFDDGGQALLLAERNSSSDRALLLIDPLKE